MKKITYTLLASLTFLSVLQAQNLDAKQDLSGTQDLSALSTQDLSTTTKATKDLQSPSAAGTKTKSSKSKDSIYDYWQVAANFAKERDNFKHDIYIDTTYNFVKSRSSLSLFGLDAGYMHRVRKDVLVSGGLMYLSTKLASFPTTCKDALCDVLGFQKMAAQSARDNTFNLSSFGFNIGALYNIKGFNLSAYIAYLGSLASDFGSTHAKDSYTFNLSSSYDYYFYNFSFKPYLSLDSMLFSSYDETSLKLNNIALMFDVGLKGAYTYKDTSYFANLSYNGIYNAYGENLDLVFKGTSYITDRLYNTPAILPLVYTYNDFLSLELGALSKSYKSFYVKASLKADYGIVLEYVGIGANVTLNYQF
ncbi:hypothetical protein [Helicobacter sp. 11S02629-2]|uniref:hypothetical protein n=1 Tax=Helicobacter sp. 11S02629-2 TaxID=1476195 RepID=UPI000BA73C5F|nr:hypothetical protein [Helicobacter sp. 11S02629-2]PAF42076.1 hypothetical protein BKH40_08095 [Helicobacter sp. 11S02629-2]